MVIDWRLSNNKFGESVNKCCDRKVRLFKLCDGFAPAHQAVISRNFDEAEVTLGVKVVGLGIGDGDGFNFYDFH